MIERILGKTGFSVSALGLGCYQFTSQFGVLPEAANDILDYAIGNGINLFDTAQSYGFGESEELLGRAKVRNAGKQLAISTKLGNLLKTTVEEVAKTTREMDWDAYLDPAAIKRAVKHSMWLLRVDQLDILMIHEYNWPMWKINFETGEGPVISILEELKKEGLIANIGLGGWDMHTAAQLVKTGKFDAVLAAGGMNLLEKPIYDELIPACLEQNTGVMLGGGFGQNTPFLIAQDKEFVELLKRNPEEKKQNMVKKLNCIYEIADELEVSMPELAIRYILAHEEIHSHVAGARELAHIKNNMQSAEKGPLPKEYVDKIDQIQKVGKCPSTEEMRDLAKELKSRS